MPANNPQAYLGLLGLVSPAIVYYFFVNKDVRKASLYLIAFFGSLFIIKLLVTLFSVNLGNLASMIIVAISTALALWLAENKVEIKSLALLAGIVIAGQLFFSQYLQSVSMGFV